MLDLIKNYPSNKKQHTILLLLVLSAVILEFSSLYFQYIMMMEPCVLCIYQRCALFGVILGGLLLSFPYLLIKIIGGIMWVYSSWNGFLLAKKQNDVQLHSSPFTTCDFYVNFPSWLPLDQWIPSIFYANGDCTEHTWYFLTLEISQWMMIIFLIYLIIPTILIIVSTKKYLRELVYEKTKNHKK